MFGDILESIQYAIIAVINWMTSIYNAIPGALGFVLFFVLLVAFLTRVLPDLVSSSGKSDKAKSSNKSSKTEVKKND